MKNKYFELNNKKIIKSCKPILEELFLKYKKKYIELFFQEKDIVINNLNLNPLIKMKIIKKIGKKYRANVQVFPLSGRFICADFLISKHRKKGKVFLRRKNDVWTIKI